MRGNLKQVDLSAIADVLYETGIGTPVEQWDEETTQEFAEMHAVIRGAFQHAADFLQAREATRKPKPPMTQERRQMFNSGREEQRNRGRGNEFPAILPERGDQVFLPQMQKGTAWEAAGPGGPAAQRLPWVLVSVPKQSPEQFLGWVLLVPLDRNGSVSDVEIGWCLVRSAWGHDYAPEAAAALLSHAFQSLGLEGSCPCLS
jgi:RimJ/RimL family protein N-acetyltransferase